MMAAPIAVQDMEASEEEDAGGTAKQSRASAASKVFPPAKTSSTSNEWRQSLSKPDSRACLTAGTVLRHPLPLRLLEYLRSPHPNG
jgi:hypothetical protein